MSETKTSNQEEAVLEFLNKNNIPYTIVHHEALFTMDGYEKIEKELGCMIPKNLFLTNRQQTKFYLLMMPGDKKFLTKEISSQISSARLSFGSEEKLNEMLSCYKGSTSLFGLLFDKNKEVHPLIDEDILKQEYLGFHPCQNTATIKIHSKDMLKILSLLDRKYTTITLKGK